MREADDIAERYVEDVAAADPITATAVGIPGHEHELTDFTPDGHAHREQLLRDARAGAPRGAVIVRLDIRCIKPPCTMVRGEVDSTVVYSDGSTTGMGMGWLQHPGASSSVV